jgi:hypothetical protein
MTWYGCGGSSCWNIPRCEVSSKGSQYESCYPRFQIQALGQLSSRIFLSHANISFGKGGIMGIMSEQANEEIHGGGTLPSTGSF